MVWSSQSPAHWTGCFLAPVSVGVVVLVFPSHSVGRETTMENFCTPHESFHLRDSQAKFGPVQCGSSLAMTAVPTV